MAQPTTLPTSGWQGEAGLHQLLGAGQNPLSESASLLLYALMDAGLFRLSWDMLDYNVNTSSLLEPFKLNLRRERHFSTGCAVVIEVGLKLAVTTFQRIWIICPLEVGRR